MNIELTNDSMINFSVCKRIDYEWPLLGLNM